MKHLLVIKTGALGDVLRTTSILPGLCARHPELTVDWVTAPAAVALVERHPRIDRVHAVGPRDEDALARLARELATRSFDRVLSFDDEEPLCRLAATFDPAIVSGARLSPEGARVYTSDVGPWFDMGLLSIHGKERADQLKKENTESHPAIFARMLGIEMGRPELPLAPEAEARAERFAQRNGWAEAGPVIGLNTGAGGRWQSKALPEERVVALAAEVDAALDAAGARRPVFVLFGGPDERERNARLRAALEARVQLVDAGVDHPLEDFAALVDRVDLLVTSDSLALHVGVARGVRIVAFFAPTSAAEIELYGSGSKVVSTAPDSCSYRKDADTSTLTVERLRRAVLAELARLDVDPLDSGSSGLRSGTRPA